MEDERINTQDEARAPSEAAAPEQREPAQAAPRAEARVEPGAVGSGVAESGAGGSGVGEAGAASDASDGSTPRPPGAKRRRRGRRGGKRHKKKPATGTTGAAEEKPVGEPGETAAPKPAARARQQQQRKPAQRKPATPRPKPAATEEKSEQAENGDEAPSEDDAATGTSPARKRRRRRRGGGGGAGGAAKKPADGEAQEQQPKEEKPTVDRSGGSTRLAARSMRKGGTGGAQRRPRKRLTEEDARRLRGGAKTMLVHTHDDRTQIAVVEDGALIEHFVARKGHRTTMAGNIYLGKVQNVLPGMEAAFVDFGRGRNGVLYAGEVNYSAEDLEAESMPKIEKVLKSGQAIMVQVTKDPIGSKGARLTSQVSLAGRYMVLAPEQALSGISRRLSENERARLRTILREIAPQDHGVIVRTAAEGATKEALELDLKKLIKDWDAIQKTAKKAKAPAPLYEEPELITRVVRDIFSGDFQKVIVDARATYEDIKAYLSETAPDLLDRVELHDGPLPLFETYRVTEQLHKALERKVWLPSGGSLVIDRTEAMTVIDVNTGKFTGKGSNLENTVYLNNLEAAEEVARQLRLRDIGGIIVIDFIDMIDPKNQQEVLRTLKRALSKDKTRSQVFEVSNLGLVEMTRKKVSEGLLDAFSEQCPNCLGRGIVITHQID